MATLTQSFFDLRSFAADAASRPSAGADRWVDPYLGQRRLLYLDDGPVTAGLIMLQAGRGSVAALDSDEFLFVLDGEISFSVGGKILVLVAGASVVVRAGTSFAWSSDDAVAIVFMSYGAGGEGPPGAVRGVVPIDEAAPLQASGAPLAELLIGPTPSCRNHTDFSSADGTFVCGTWDSTPYHRRPMFYRHHELMFLLEGAVTLEDEHGSARTFEKGDLFLVKRGSTCSWESLVPVKKVYAIYRPA